MYKITYETHCHKEDGTYDKKLDQKERVVSENYQYKCRPYWHNQNKIEDYNVPQIKNFLNKGYFNERRISGSYVAQYLLSEGKYINGKYHYEKIINIEKA